MNEWMSTEQVADYLSVSRDTIRRMISRGEIEAKRFGPRLIRISRASVDAMGTPLVPGESIDD